MTFDTQKTVESLTGATLNLYTAAPKAPRAVVQLNHGLSEHAARYARFAAFLKARGVALYAHDHRGHGHTKAPDAPLGHFGTEPAAHKVVADVAAVHDAIARDHPGVPVIVFGHSMGSLIAMNFMLKHSDRAAGAAIWNGNFSAGVLGRLAQLLLAWETFRLGSDVPSRILPKLTFGAWAKEASDGRTPFDWLSRDQAEVDLYIADPLCGWDPSVGMWKAVFDFVFAGADDRNFADIPRNMPFHLIGGSGDPESRFGKTVTHLADRMRRMGFSNLVSTIYPETRHESLNELNRDVIMADFGRWIDDAVLGEAAKR
ncbi:alpha/beta fold hydrolase [Neoaquamicrobium sediminum]|uniref:alpha/beta fold hydrolase n=1 Tax=Neoaquamicrobium sediminum TaxID=1849104 RepID=UPI0015675198|nr:alpha/beta hydrolase [Mesorhizobium sediminum]NRC55553.1 alpha/beta hydrolase [Mesorhizobium sediminum]